MKGHYHKVPDSTKKKKFPEPRVEPHQYKEPIGPHKPSVGERIRTAIAPYVKQGKATGHRVQLYAATRSHAIDHNLVRGRFNPMTTTGQNWMNMSFPGGGFGVSAPAPRRPAAPAPRRKRRKSRQRQDDDGWGWGMPRY